MKHIISFLLCILFNIVCYADWNIVNTGISDNFNGVFYSYNTSILAGNNGLYYTLTGINGTWTRFNVIGNSNDSIIYNHTRFYKMTEGTSEVYVCGVDTVAQKAIIASLNISTLTFTIHYIGSVGTKLNAITSKLSGGLKLYAVGDNGLIVTKYGTAPCNTVITTSMNDLYSVNTSTFTNRVVISGDQTIIEGIESGSNLVTTVYPNTGQLIKGLLSYNTGFYGVGNDYYFVNNNQGQTITYPNYDFGSLNATSITRGSWGIYVSTNHGVFKTVGTQSNRLEYQPSSNGFDLNDISFGSTSASGAACGNNGVLISTTDGGGFTKPFASFDSVSGCKNTNLTYYSNPGSGTSCEWRVNSTLVSTSCVSLIYGFSNSGNYFIDFIVTANGLKDTVRHATQIVDIPNINIPYTITDSILCKNEPLQLVIQNTQPNVNYYLTWNSQNFGSVSGTGGTVTLNSDSGLFSHNYILKAQNNSVQCSKNFPQNISITVEKTKSSFHSSLKNAIVNEPLFFNSTSKDAQNYSWTFGPNASQSVSNIKSPQNINFSSLGNTNIELISWSNNGCYDTLIASGPFIYQPPLSEDTCWAFNVDCNDPIWTGHYFPRINQSIPYNNNLFICGTAMEDSFKTRYGEAPERTINGGAYVANYSSNGVYRWSITSRDSLYVNQTQNKSTTTSIAIDNDGNVYIGGLSYEYEEFTDNNGEVYRLADNNFIFGSPPVGYIAKFDSVGRFIWANQFRNSFPNKLLIDNNQHLVIMGSVGFYQSELIYYHQSSVDTIFKNLQSLPSSKNNFIMKTDTAGNKLWCLRSTSTFANQGGFYDLDLDDSDNLYVTGCFETYTTFFNSTNYSIPIDTVYLLPHTNQPKTFIVKYNSNGIYQWHNRIHTDLFPTSISADPDGNTYITGLCRISSSFDSLTIDNASGSITRKSIGNYFLIKTNHSGDNIWAVGSKYSNGGSGYSVWSGNNEVLVAGYITNSQPLTTWSGLMTSTDGNDQLFSLGNSDLFFASYDTSGVINFLTKTGNNEDKGWHSNGNIYRNKFNHLFYAGDFKRASLQPYYFSFFYDSLTSNGYDGVISKMGRVPCTPIITSNKETFSNQTNLVCYPNPVSNDLNIVINDAVSETNPVKIIIRNVLGQPIFIKTFSSNSIQLHVGTFLNSEGMYFIEALNGSSNIKTKFLFCNMK